MRDSSVILGPSDQSFAKTTSRLATDHDHTTDTYPAIGNSTIEDSALVLPLRDPRVPQDLRTDAPYADCFYFYFMPSSAFDEFPRTYSIFILAPADSRELVRAVREASCPTTITPADPDRDVPRTCPTTLDDGYGGYISFSSYPLRSSSNAATAPPLSPCNSSTGPVPKSPTVSVALEESLHVDRLAVVIRAPERVLTDVRVLPNANDDQPYDRARETSNCQLAKAGQYEAQATPGCCPRNIGLTAQPASRPRRARSLPSARHPVSATASSFFKSLAPAAKSISCRAGLELPTTGSAANIRRTNSANSDHYHHGRPDVSINASLDARASPNIATPAPRALLGQASSAPASRARPPCRGADVPNRVSSRASDSPINLSAPKACTDSLKNFPTQNNHEKYQKNPENAQINSTPSYDPEDDYLWCTYVTIDDDTPEEGPVQPLLYSVDHEDFLEELEEGDTILCMDGDKIFSAHQLMRSSSSLKKYHAVRQNGPLQSLTAYKRVDQKVKPVPAVYPEDAKVERRFPEDPLLSLVSLPYHPPDFTPDGGRLTQERLDEMELNPTNFLQPEELKLFQHVMKLHQNHFVWEDHERGSFREDYFSPYIIPVVPHVPWAFTNIPIPPALRDKVVELLREKIAAGVYEPSQSSHQW